MLAEDVLGPNSSAPVITTLIFLVTLTGNIVVSLPVGPSAPATLQRACRHDENHALQGQI